MEFEDALRLVLKSKPLKKRPKKTPRAK